MKEVIFFCGRRPTAGVGIDFLQLNAELLRQLLDNLVVELRRLTLLEHRQSILLAADFTRHNALRQPGRAASVSELDADLWIQVLHGRIF